MATKDLITMIVQILIGIGVLVGGIVFILKWCNKVMLKITKIEQQLKDMPLKIEGSIIKQFLPFATTIINSQNNPLSPEDIDSMKRLMNKLQNNTITISESEKLKGFLEIEKDEAEKKNNANLLLAIAIAMAAIGIVIALSKQE